MTHDPLCPVASTEAEIYWRAKCPYCTLIFRAREHESHPAQVVGARAMKLTWRDYAYVIGVGLMAVALGLFFRWGS